MTASSIRYYESIGLLPEPERERGQRRYDDSVLGRLAFIGVAQAAGFKLTEISELIAAAAARPRSALFSRRRERLGSVSKPSS